ncbi:xanthine dehydrogenase family protein molybdopterin-binding subunit [Treponema sp. UBA7570]|uniref:xanthine dehydrogenase family protein molybdopterin-binding subunit n=1 Tax=Treponema sp. UBA7570 TaxID=1947749 RepID=UPI0025E0075B|nr:xanthine dehydrogenase family protein [Treponema sp. UBA7570]
MCTKRKIPQKNTLIFSDEFYSDIFEDDMLYASVVRSPVPKGRIIKILTEELPEGYNFYGCEDLPFKKNIKISGTNIPVFCEKDIDYAGQAIGIITGPNKKNVRLLSKNIKMNIDEHFYYEEKNENSNILAQREVKYGQDYELQEEDSLIEEEWESDINFQNFTETNGAFCYIKSQNLYVFSPNLWISNLRKNLSDITGFPEENIYITRTKILSKTTDIIWLNTLICCQCALACLKLKKPIKLEFTRTEQQFFAENTSSVKIRHKTAVAKSGLIKSMDILIHVNAGAYNPFAQEIADRLAIAAIGVYKCPNIKITSNIYKSHSIPSSIDFSIIASKAFYAVENQMNKISRETGIDPLELRILNLKIEDRHNRSKIILETGKSKEVLEAICRTGTFLRKNAAYKMEDIHRFDHDNASPYAPPLRGIGLACAYEGTAYLGSNFIKKNLNIELSYTKDQKLYIRGMPSSKNAWQIWQKTASEITGLPAENIFLNTNYSIDSEPENPQTTNASISINSVLIKKACEALARKLSKTTDEEFPVTIKKSFSVNPRKSWDLETFSGYPFSSTSFAAMIAEIELDSASYSPQLRGIWFIADAGKILNPHAAETSLKNSIQEGLKELVEDDELSVSSISIQFMQSNDEPKQLGDIAASLLPAAYASALSQAVGKTITNMPVQTDTVFKLTKSLKENWEKQKEAEENKNSEETTELK